MDQGIELIIYPVSDLEAAKRLWTTLLGDGPATDTPYYVGFEAGPQQIGLDPNGHASGLTGPVPFRTVADLPATLATLETAGATVHQPPRDVGAGKQTAVLADTDGNLIGLVQNPA